MSRALADRYSRMMRRRPTLLLLAMATLLVGSSCSDSETSTSGGAATCSANERFLVELAEFRDSADAALGESSEASDLTAIARDLAIAIDERVQPVLDAASSDSTLDDSPAVATAVATLRTERAETMQRIEAGDAGGVPPGLALNGAVLDLRIECRRLFPKDVSNERAAQAGYQLCVAHDFASHDVELQPAEVARWIIDLTAAMEENAPDIDLGELEREEPELHGRYLEMQRVRSLISGPDAEPGAEALPFVDAHVAMTEQCAEAVR